MAEDNIVNLNNYKTETEQLAKEIVSTSDFLSEDLTAALQETTNMLNETLGLSIDEETVLEIGALFSLPDDKFDLISNEFLKVLEKNIGNPDEKIAIAQSLNLSNLKAEDLAAMVDQFEEIIEDSFKGTLSDLKLAFIKKILYTIVNAVNETQCVSKRIVSVPFEKCSEDAIKPTYAHEGDAGADVYSLEEVTLMPGETKIVKTGIKVAIPSGYEIQIRPRSGLSSKSKLRIANTPGTIDSGYRGEIGIICENISSPIEALDFHYDDDKKVIIDSIVAGRPITIEKGQKIAQLVLSEIPIANYFETVNISDDTERASGGFGSTGI